MSLASVDASVCGSTASDEVITSSDLQMVITTINPDKAEDFLNAFSELGIPIQNKEIDVNEIQADWKKLTGKKAKRTMRKLKKLGFDVKGKIFLVEDTSLECGEPDPKKLPVPGHSTKDFIKRCSGRLHHITPLVGSPKVTYRCTCAIVLPTGEVIICTATTEGFFVEKRDGKGLIDTQFVPHDDPEQRTISQMPLEHRMIYHPRFKLCRLVIEELQKRFSF
jgi:inosine/xanthosine triphosphate pyrophosphatase family protein